MNETLSDSRPFPKALWIGTAFFFLLAAAVLLLLLQKGEERSRIESTARIEGRQVTLNAEQMKRLGREAASGSVRRRGR